MNPDELDPPRPSLKPVDFQPMSLEDIRGYIATLRAEIARAEHAIAAKENHRRGIDALFGGST